MRKSDLAARLAAAFVGVALALAALAASPAEVAAVGRVVTVLVGIVVTAAAARAFAHDDPPRRPWSIRAAALVLLLAARLVDPLQAALLPGPRVRLAHVLIIVANALGAAAMVGFAAVIRASGLGTRERGAGDLALGAAALVAALVAARTLAGIQGPLLDTSDLASWVRALALTASTLADAIVFIVAAGLVRVLAPMRDGVVAWPYLLLAIDGACFLVLDLASTSEYPALVGLTEVVSVIGASAGIVAALAQIAIVRASAPASAPA